MGYTPSISRTIQPIAVKLSQNVANNNKNSHVTVGGHFDSRIEEKKMPLNPYFMQKR